VISVVIVDLVQFLRKKYLSFVRGSHLYFILFCAWVEFFLDLSFFSAHCSSCLGCARVGSVADSVFRYLPLVTRDS
jgi:hypothetical protein